MALEVFYKCFGCFSGMLDGTVRTLHSAYNLCPIKLIYLLLLSLGCKMNVTKVVTGAVLLTEMADLKLK